MRSEYKFAIGTKQYTWQKVKCRKPPDYHSGGSMVLEWLGIKQARKETVPVCESLEIGH